MKSGLKEGLRTTDLKDILFAGSASAKDQLYLKVIAN